MSLAGSSISWPAPRSALSPRSSVALPSRVHALLLSCNVIGEWRHVLAVAE